MKKVSFKQVMAIIAIALLVLMYLLLMVFAIIDIPNWKQYFFACVGMTIVVPILAWICIAAHNFQMKRIEASREEGEVTVSLRDINREEKIDG